MRGVNERCEPHVHNVQLGHRFRGVNARWNARCEPHVHYVQLGHRFRGVNERCECEV